jgi:hypothetical protein
VETTTTPSQNEKKTVNLGLVIGFEQNRFFVRSAAVGLVVVGARELNERSSQKKLSFVFNSELSQCA